MRIDTAKRLSQKELETPVEEFVDSFDLTFTIDQTVEEVLATLQSRMLSKQRDYFYITDKENVLQGVLNLYDIVYNPPDTKLADIFENDVFKIYHDQPLEQALKLLADHQILVLPVVNRDNRFVGVLEILPHEEPPQKAKKIYYKRLKEDIFQFIGISIEQRRISSPWHAYRLRMPWLMCNLIGGLICALISDFFRLTLMEFVVLAFFIPLVLTLSESVGIQSMTLSLRFLHLRKIHWFQVFKRLFLEGKSTLLLGVSSALIISFFYFLWNVSPKPILGISLSVITAMMVSALFGGLFPIIIHSLKLDPKVAAGPVVLMMADIFTITIYLGLSTLILL